MRKKVGKNERRVRTKEGRTREVKRQIAERTNRIEERSSKKKLEERRQEDESV